MAFGAKKSTLEGRVFRSDTNVPVASCYILLKRDKHFRPGEEKHFDLRTDEKGNYRFSDIPAGRYTVSLAAWFRSEIPCRNSSEAKTADHGSVAVDRQREWQSRSDVFGEVVTIKGLPISADRDLVRHKMVKDFDLRCQEQPGICR